MARAQGSPAFPASALCSRRGACSDKSVSRRRAFRRRREPPRKRRPYPSIRPFVDRGPRSPPEYRAPHRAAAPLRGVSLLYAAAPRSAAHSRGPFPWPRRLWKRAGETVVCGKFPDTLPASCRLQRFAASRSPGKAPRLARERERVRQGPSRRTGETSRRRTSRPTRGGKPAGRREPAGFFMRRRPPVFGSHALRPAAPACAPRGRFSRRGGGSRAP